MRLLGIIGGIVGLVSAAYIAWADLRLRFFCKPGSKRTTRDLPYVLGKQDHARFSSSRYVDGRDA